MKNYTFAFKDLDELDTLLKNTKYDSEKTLIQVFYSSTNTTNIKELQLYTQEKFPLSTLIGTTTDGVVYGSDVHCDTKSVITFTIFEDTLVKSFICESKDYHNDSYLLGKELTKNIVRVDTKVIISFADGINTNGEEFVKGVNDISPTVLLSGGLAADNGKLIKTFVFDKYIIVDNGAVGASLSGERLQTSNNYTFDWTPIGKILTVTKSIKNRVYEIDGINAIDIYAKYMGDEIAKKLPQVGIEFPLIFKKDGVDVGRAVLFKHDDGSLTFAGNIKEGTQVRLGIGNVDNILKNSNYNAQKILHDIKYDVEAIFVYSCMARRRFLNEYISKELDTLNNIGNLSGFFTYGEFYHYNNNNELLNETMTFLVLTESDKLVNKVLAPEHNYEKTDILESQQALAHLANTVSLELEELNSSLEKRVKDSSEYIYRQAYFDKLTKLPNRLSLIKRLSDCIGQVLMLINIDDFTTINDFYGHEVGDGVLKKLAYILKELAQIDKAEVFKLPSDEFAVIIGLNNIDVSIEKKIKEYISHIENKEFFIDGNSTHVSVTISAAYINNKGTGFSNADMALKLAKKSNKEYMIFNEDLKLAKQYEKNIKLANIIKQAIATKKIIPYFQPIFNTQTKSVEKYESLVRLEDKNGDILSPYLFLDISKKIKLYPHITRIMIDSTFKFFKENGVDFSINIDFKDIFNDKTVEYLFDKIQEYDIASQLTIEILETLSNDNKNVVNKFIDRIYMCGAKIAIDDFGSGYANFQHMTEIKSDYMKIDGSLIKNIDKDPNARLIVETIVVFAKKLNKKTIAEFVHSKEVYEIVKELDIDFVQGYYLGEPKPYIL
jgi:diguanylate cyclase (GGDEF)-like protein